DSGASAGGGGRTSGNPDLDRVPRGAAAFRLRTPRGWTELPVRRDQPGRAEPRRSTLTRRDAGAGTGTGLGASERRRNRADAVRGGDPVMDMSDRTLGRMERGRFVRILSWVVCLALCSSVVSSPSGVAFAQAPSTGGKAPASTLLFLTDFGVRDDAVAICKGVILGIVPDVR